MKELWKEKGLWSASLICFVTMAVGFPFDEIKFPLSSGAFLVLFQKALDNQMILFLIPIAAVLPVGANFVRESSTGFLKLYITRISRMEYIKRKTIQIYAGGFLPFFMAGIAALFLCFLFLYPLELKGNISWQMVSSALAFLLRISLTAGIMAELAGIFAAAFQNYYMTYGLPFVSYYMMIILKERYLDQMYVFYPAEWMKCQQDWGPQGHGIWLFLAVFSIFMILLHGLLLYGRLQEIL